MGSRSPSKSVTIAAVSLNGENVIRVQSEGYPPVVVELDSLDVRESERNTSAAIIRGIAAWFRRQGADLAGFSAYVMSSVLGGSGLSSSAAFEILFGKIMNDLFFDGRCSAIQLAQVGQYAENVYFGKPSGLLDQMGCSVPCHAGGRYGCRRSRCAPARRRPRLFPRGTGWNSAGACVYPP